MRIFFVVNCSGARFLKNTDLTIHRINLPFITSRLLGTFVNQTELSTSLELSLLKNVHAVTSTNHEGSILTAINRMVTTCYRIYIALLSGNS